MVVHCSQGAAGQCTSMWAYCFFGLLLHASVTARKDKDHNDIVVDTENGQVRGFYVHLPHLGKGVNTFLGIPFAKPPLGHLRFRHPVPKDKWNGILNATKSPNSCYQSVDDTFGTFVGSNMWNPTTPVSEDCLYLNVWVPKHQKRLRKSAVLVWIYGGGFYSGTSTLNCYDGKTLAVENNIIVVSINYRVGMLGFLAMDHPDAPGNAGLFDQLMGLEWVQQNIKYFGGDPNNVTLFGESAGSVSVSLHLLSPLSRSKFQRAIMQSGTANMPWGTLVMGEAYRRASDLRSYIKECNNVTREDTKGLLHCLKGVSPQSLVEQQWVSNGNMEFPFLPVIDGAFLTETPRASLENGNFKRCPILLGSNANEGSWFVIYDLPSYLALDKKTMTYQQFQDSMDTLMQYYPQYPQEINSIGREAIKFQYSDFADPENEDRNLASIEAAVAEKHFICHVNSFANTYARAGEMVYMYYFTQRYSSNPWPPWMGVLHGDEILFTFGDPLKRGTNYTEEEKRFSRTIMNYWTNFAKTGDPNRAPGVHSLNEWPLHTQRGKEYLELNTKFLNNPDKSAAVGRGLRTNACAFWNHYLPHLVQQTRDISELEVEWKQQFHEWSTKYIVDWKIQYDMYKKRHQTCSDGG